MEEKTEGRLLPRAAFLLLLQLMLLAALTVGCGRREELADGETAYTVYYLNAAGDKLTGSSYVTAQTDQEALIGELLAALASVPPELDCQSAMPGQVEKITFRVEENVLFLYMDANYVLMDSVREIFCRAALTKTLTQAEGIDYLSIYCAGQPIVDSAGNPVGMLQASDFVESIRNINSFERTELTLYFANAAGDKLVAESREVMRDSNTSLERLIVEQLIEGPDETGLLATLPSDVKILNVAVSDSVCSINFDSAFLNNTAGLSEYIPIYSIVDSLTELSTVNRVQIRINGSQEFTFWDKIPLNTVFERNYDYIDGEEES